MNKLIIGMSLLFSTSIFANQTLHFDNKTLTLNGTQPKFSAVINYPQIQNPMGSSELKFNIIAKQWALSKLKEFKQAIADNAKYPIPKEVQAEGNTLTLSYDLATIEPHKFISLRYSDDMFIAGAAHGSHKYYAINYDLLKNKPIGLVELFKNEQAALNQLSQLSTTKVTAKLKQNPDNQNVDIFSEGLTPVAKNYQVWNITPKGVQLTFNEYQVVAYVYGPQVITLSFDELKNQLDANSALAKCLATNSCNIQQFAPKTTVMAH